MRNGTMQYFWFKTDISGLKPLFFDVRIYFADFCALEVLMG